MNNVSIKTETPSVCAIILSYGSRTEQVRKVLEAVFKQGAGYVLVVANDVIAETLKMLNDYKQTYPMSIEIIASKENLGSAGGYAKGLSSAIKGPFEYIWLLDDDNLPQENALKNLLEAFSIYQKRINRAKIALQSLRGSLPEMIDILNKGYHSLSPRPASFIGFHVFNIFDIKLSFIFKNSLNVDSKNKKVPISLRSAPYGGFFFHRDAFHNLGFPNPDFFLYADDLAYTLNFTSRGGHIFLVPESRIIDIDPVWNATGGKTSNFYKRLKILSSKRVYYEVRNRIYIGRKYFPGNRILYFLNKFIYLTILGLSAIYYRRCKRYKLIYRAAREGESGRLGERNLEI